MATPTTNLGTDLRPYQDVALAFLLAHQRAILGDAPGTGKTPITAVALREAGASRILAVVPRAVLHHWGTELARWFPQLEVIDGHGNKGKRTRARDAVGVAGVQGRVPPAPRLLLVNYEALRQDIDYLIRLRFDTLVCDEAHRLKNRQALQTRAAWKLAGRVPRCWLLTGTPIPNRPDEAWSLLHMLRPNSYSSYWRWVEQHMYVQPVRFAGRGQWTKVVAGLRPGAVGRIRAELGDVLLQRSLDELLPHLPPATITPIEIDLDPEERRVYESLRTRNWAQLDDGSVVQTINKVSQITRFRQIVSDMDALGATRAKPGSKIQAALDLISDLDQQVVVLTWSRLAAERVASESGGVYVHGGLDTVSRQASLDTFQQGRAMVIAGTLGTLAEGVDGLQVARHVILLDRPWRPSDEDQAIGRIRRSGQQSAVFAWVITARGTIDQAINQLLASKRSVIDAITKGDLKP